jgi:hypothetical protein
MPASRDDEPQGGGLLDMLGALLGLGGKRKPAADAGDVDDMGLGAGGDSLTESILRQFTPQIVRAISERLGVDEGIVRMGLSVAIPLLLSALARNSRTPEGAEAISRALQEDHDGTVLARLPQAVEQYESGPGAGILRHVLGDKNQTVQRTLTKSTGADGGAMLQMAAPVVMGALGKVQRERNLDASGLALLLQEEQIGQSGDIMRVITGMLDADRDGSAADDAADLLGRVFGPKA